MESLKAKASVTADAKTRTTNGAAKSGVRASTASKSAPPPARSVPAGRPSVASFSAPAARAAVPSSATTAAKRVLGSSTTSRPPPSTSAPSKSTTATTSAVAARRQSGVVPVAKTPVPRPSSVTQTAAAKSALRSSSAVNKSPTDPPPTLAGNQPSSPTPSTAAPAKSKSLSTDVAKKSMATRSSATAGPPPVARHVAGRASISVVSRGAAPTFKDSKEPPKDTSKGNEELEAQLGAATTELATKTEQIANLEQELATLRENLQDAISQSVAHTEDLEKLQTAVKEGTVARQILEGDLQTLKESAANATAKIEALLQANAELERTGAHLADSEGKIATLAADLASVQNELAKANEALRSAADAKSFDQQQWAESAAIDPNAELHAIQTHVATLTATHTDALSAGASKEAELRTLVDAHEGTITSLRSKLDGSAQENTDLAARISELEVEVLESKDATENALDEHRKEVAALKAQHWQDKDLLTKTLQEDLQRAVAAHQQATKEWEETSKTLRERHSTELAAAITEAENKAVGNGEAALKALSQEHERLIAVKEGQHTTSLAELTSAHEASSGSLKETIDKLTEELKGREAKFEAQVREIKGQQDALLQKAFDDAKIEAGSTHSTELSSVRAESQASLERLRTGFQHEIEELKTTHAETLGEQTKMSEKHAKELTLNLAATTDDLAKSKAALAAAQTEIASLKTQVEEANRAAEAASINADAQLKGQTVQAKQEAQNAREDLATFKQLLAESQESFAADMEGTKATHKRELEEVVAKHVEHTGALKASHGQELAQLSNEGVKLRSALEDEREAKEKALAQIASLQQVRSPPPSPRNGNAAGVGKDEIEKLHRAHNATLMTLEAEHNSGLRALKDELARKQEAVDEVRAEKERKELEISFMAEEKRDVEDELQRHLEEMNELKAQLASLKSSA
ncbi:hypothetical protein BS47DRAFT_1362016 [Hydnum rufescens UP504]|uniref:Uncharacterized protein n=1 Tax=Hydnum rufescens UP504 TaxID=1448309 RepID=A0A9P6AXZ3_9AGAM|nr:hypothetical protein BS47DRAFT_1362016 [Hydnum rufescens UP504]